MLSQEDLQGSLAFLRKTQPETVNELLFYQLEAELREVIKPEFFKQIEKCGQLEGIALVDGFAKATQLLTTEMAKFLTGDSIIRNECFLRLKALLFHTISSPLADVLCKYYRRTLDCYTQAQSADDSIDRDGNCEVCEKSMIKCVCGGIVERFRKLNQQM